MAESSNSPVSSPRGRSKPTMDPQEATLSAGDEEIIGLHQIAAHVISRAASRATSCGSDDKLGTTADGAAEADVVGINLSAFVDLEGPRGTGPVQLLSDEQVQHGSEAIASVKRFSGSMLKLGPRRGPLGEDSVLEAPMLTSPRGGRMVKIEDEIGDSPRMSPKFSEMGQPRSTSQSEDRALRLPDDPKAPSWGKAERHATAAELGEDGTCFSPRAGGRQQVSPAAVADPPSPAWARGIRPKLGREEGLARMPSPRPLIGDPVRIVEPGDKHGDVGTLVGDDHSEQPLKVKHSNGSTGWYTRSAVEGVAEQTGASTFRPGTLEAASEEDEATAHGDSASHLKTS